MKNIFCDKLKHHHHLQLNPKKTIFKICFSATMLAISTFLSLIEIKIYIFSAAEFDFRVFDNIILFLTVYVLGLRYGIINAFLQPWIHLAIDGDHSAISMVFYGFDNFLLVCFFYFIYLKTKQFQNKKLNFFIFIIKFISLIIISSFIEISIFYLTNYIALLSHSIKDRDKKLAAMFKYYVILIFFAVYFIKYIFVFLIVFFIFKRIFYLRNHYKQ